MNPLDELISSIETLAADRPQAPLREHGPNEFYGQATMLKAYAGWPTGKPLPVSIEHGTRFHAGLWQHDSLPKHRIGFVPSQWRVEMLAGRVDQELHAIGPYIHYAQSIWSPAELDAARAACGRMLLVYPAHSTHWVDADYDVDVFCERIRAVSDYYDSVLVCVYWKDVLRGVHRRYRERGFQCVTAGHIYDAQFMRRQRALLEVSTAVLTNQLGSHLGYAMSLGKPVQLQQSEVDRSSAIKSMLQTYERLDDDRFHALFAPPPKEITPDQMTLVQKYWGLTPVKSPEEIKALLLRAEELRRHYVFTLGLPQRLMRLWRFATQRKRATKTS